MTRPALFKQLLLSFAIAAGLAQFPAHAAWPERPITLVVPYPAGGVADTVSRALAREAGNKLGQQVIVENRPGASGKIGLEAVKRAPADGYTVGLVVPATMVLLPLADPQFGLSLRDFEPLIIACDTYTVLVVNPQLNARTLADFVSYARARPGAVNYGSAGAGTSFHFGAALLAQKLGIRTVHVAYKGENPALSDLAAGHVQYMLATNSAKPFIDAGRLVPLAVSAPQRVASLPAVPTFRELGVDFANDGWIGYVAPAGVPADILDRLASALQQALKVPALAQTLTGMGYAPVGGSRQAMRATIEQGQARYRPLVQSGAVKLSD